MKRFLATALVVSLLSTGAFAFGGTSNSHNNNDNVNNSSTNNVGGGAGGSSTSNAGGGQGGAGGSANQGQKQGQIGINKSKNDNYNKIDDSGNSKSKSAVKDSGNSSSNSGSKSKSGSLSNSMQAQDASSDNTINIGGDNFEASYIPVNTAYAPTVIATSDCLGSISAGGQGQFLGLTFGKTTQSKPCNVREFAKMNAADVELYYTIQCQDPIMKEAYKVRGTYNKFCIGAKAKTKSKWFGLGSVKAYEEICAYPTAECKHYKKFN